MHLTGSFCVVLLMHCVQILNAVPISYDYNQVLNEVDGIEYDQSKENIQEAEEAEVKYVSAVARNKRSYDYWNAYSSSESDEDNYGYYHKPTRYYYVQPNWAMTTPPPQRYYGFVPPGHSPDHHKKNHRGPPHHKKYCKYPNHEHSGEYEDNYDFGHPVFGKFGHDKGIVTTTTEKFPKSRTTTSSPSSSPNIDIDIDNGNGMKSSTNVPYVPSSASSTPSSTPSTTTSTEIVPFTSIIASSSTTSTSTTEGGPLFDIRNSD